MEDIELVSVDACLGTGVPSPPVEEEEDLLQLDLRDTRSFRRSRRIGCSADIVAAAAGLIGTQNTNRLLNYTHCILLIAP